MITYKGAVRSEQHGGSSTDAPGFQAVGFRRHAFKRLPGDQPREKNSLRATQSVWGNIEGLASKKERTGKIRSSSKKGTGHASGQSNNFACAISLPTTVDLNYWVLKGVALFCALDDCWFST